MESQGAVGLCLQARLPPFSSRGMWDVGEAQTPKGSEASHPSGRLGARAWSPSWPGCQAWQEAGRRVTWALRGALGAEPAEGPEGVGAWELARGGGGAAREAVWPPRARQPVPGRA